jgi:hypothetical protein
MNKLDIFVFYTYYFIFDSTFIFSLISRYDLVSILLVDDMKENLENNHVLCFEQMSDIR